MHLLQCKAFPFKLNCSLHCESIADEHKTRKVPGLMKLFSLTLVNEICLTIPPLEQHVCSFLFPFSRVLEAMKIPRTYPIYSFAFSINWFWKSNVLENFITRVPDAWVPNKYQPERNGEKNFSNRERVFVSYR